jgi:hypothetical protein
MPDYCPGGNTHTHSHQYWPDPAHIWVVYNWDNGYHAISIHLTAEEAAQVAAKTGYAHAGKWPLGVELDDAIREWEG